MTQEEREKLIQRLEDNRLSEEQLLKDPIWLKIEGPKVEKSTECYVYLMKDTANGRYKIGMSKKPEYREKTLQSEKPEITLICSKKYSSRDEARKTEKELHQKFKKSRIRGEWFNLSDSEVKNVRLYLEGPTSAISGAAWDTSQEYRFGYIPINP